tara:strand:- start:801 stop:1412 length:612 start_codon:yes stop_codon:yes gene_type:complete
MDIDRVAHWEKVYETKVPSQVSWTQEYPKTSFEIIQSFELPKTAKIIDVGGGDSKLVDCLLDAGYEDITVLDISKKALVKAQQRLGDKASKVNWVVSDITIFKPDRTFDIWHDRAAFHFLTEAEQISQYVAIASSCVKDYLSVGTFSKQGPAKCSGLNVSQYSEEELMSVFSSAFHLLDSKTEDHTTPFDTLQNFLFCSFKKK